MQNQAPIIRKYFGTDGIRGKANLHPMTPELVLRLGQAAGKIFRTTEHRRHTVVIGKDTRLSGYLFESALQAGFTSVGIHCLLVGPIPTPGIAFLTRALRADAGVMISASHNPYFDNGIKFFAPNGMKLPDEREAEIERLMESPDLLAELPAPHDIGRARRIDDAQGRYIEFCKKSFTHSACLGGFKLVLDCGHGAAYKVAPAVFWELGAEVITLGISPNGTNINDGCGSLHPEGLRERVLAEGADVGLAFDGDADRLIVCDEKGNILDGDRILAMCAQAMHAAGTLRGGGVVATVMSNLGLERFLQQRGLHLTRTQVGDRYVLEEMLAHGYNLGGEQSGHFLFLDHNTTGDGIISALRVLEQMALTGRTLSELAAGMELVPQILKNVKVSPGTQPLQLDPVQAAIARAEAAMAGNGRVLVRMSGTEPKARVMMEGDDGALIEALTDEVCAVIQQEAGEGKP